MRAALGLEGGSSFVWRRPMVMFERRPGIGLSRPHGVERRWYQMAQCERRCPQAVVGWTPLRIGALGREVVPGRRTEIRGTVSHVHPLRTTTALSELIRNMARLTEDLTASTLYAGLLRPITVLDRRSTKLRNKLPPEKKTPPAHALGPISAN